MLPSVVSRSEVMDLSMVSVHDVETVTVLKDGGLLIFEHSAAHNFWEHPNFCEIRTYGSVNFSIFKLFGSDDLQPEEQSDEQIDVPSDVQPEE